MPDLPKTLADLDLSDGPETTRVHDVCAHNKDHTVLFDSWASWDLLGQGLLHADLQTDEPKCSDCESHLLQAACAFDNKDVVVRLLSDLQSRIARLSRAETLKPSQIPTCAECGGEDVFLDAHSEYDPHLNRFELTNAYDKGHQCNTCDHTVRITYKSLSNHAQIVIAQARRDAIASLRADVEAIKLWRAANSDTPDIPFAPKTPISIP